MKKYFECATEYQYNGYYIYKITKKDYCVFSENGIIIDAKTLKDAKFEIDNM